jgi:hypothetical protein
MAAVGVGAALLHDELCVVLVVLSLCVSDHTRKDVLIVLLICDQNDC